MRTGTDNLPILNNVAQPGPAMQARQAALGIPTPTFVGRELADIQAYIRHTSTLRERDVVFLEPPNPNTGQRLFATKGCTRCHGTVGGGTSFGPDLRVATQRLQDTRVAPATSNHKRTLTWVAFTMMLLLMGAGAWLLMRG